MPKANAPAVKRVYIAPKTYRGPYKGYAPDLIVGTRRISRQLGTAIAARRAKFFLTTKAWSGDHCGDQSLVPGIMFCNRKIDAEHPRLMDIGRDGAEMFWSQHAGVHGRQALTVSNAA